MAAAANYNLKIQQRATFSLKFAWTAGGVAVDLTGSIARMQLRRMPTSAALVTLASPDAIVLGGTEGTIAIELSDEQTTALDGKGVWDLLIVHADGRVRRLFEGTFEVSPGVTQ